MSAIASNWVCWLIILLSFFCYEKLLSLYFKVTGEVGFCQGFCQGFHTDQRLITVMIAVLPLLGLLGTIVGLLHCFSGLSVSGDQQTGLSEGVGDALLSTQLALLCVVPAYVFNAVLVASFDRELSIKGAL